ncbi:hypothetical protein [Litoreibacter roseus]|uniref:Lipoprotein n=1 Tax=Litoreibacter roseus TaxID=2601869 RepID=A0A6N6JBT5_9RHOB|nr:hypothetical protein [Litoreibacter roseus]GFE63743.1 hypothetical protein KIN_08170 [Litoreibacter roseus]
MLKAAIRTCLCISVLAGCSSITPAGLGAAIRLDPVGTPPGDLTVAVSVPDALGLRDGDAEFRLAFVPDDPNAADPVNVTVPLNIREGTTGPRTAAADEAIYVLGFSAQNADLIAAAQDRIKALKDQQIAGNGQLSITVEGGCLKRSLDGRLPVSTWLRTDPEAGFVPLTRRVDLFDALPREERAQLEAKLVPC